MNLESYFQVRIIDTLVIDWEWGRILFVRFGPIRNRIQETIGTVPAIEWPTATDDEQYRNGFRNFDEHRLGYRQVDDGDLGNQLKEDFGGFFRGGLPFFLLRVGRSTIWSMHFSFCDQRMGRLDVGLIYWTPIRLDPHVKQPMDCATVVFWERWWFPLLDLWIWLYPMTTISLKDFEDLIIDLPFSIVILFCLGSVATSANWYECVWYFLGFDGLYFSILMPARLACGVQMFDVAPRTSVEGGRLGYVCCTRK